MGAAEPPRIEELLPHRGPALLLERVLEHDGETTTVRVAIGSQRWLRREDGSVASWLALEYMAQCAAVHESIRALLEGRPAVSGLLASASAVRLYCDHFGSGEVLHVRTRRLRGRPGLGALVHRSGVFAGDVGDTGKLLAEGRLCVSVSRPASAAACDPRPCPSAPRRG